MELEVKDVRAENMLSQVLEECQGGHFDNEISVGLLNVIHGG